MPGAAQWPRTEHSEPLPPPFRKLPGRPKGKKRRPEVGETSKGVKKGKFSRACNSCGGLGHNIKTCKSGPSHQPQTEQQPQQPNQALYLLVSPTSIRFGLDEAHGKGQALQFNWLFEKEAFVMHSDGRFSVDFDKVEDAVKGLSREILTIQATGDKNAAGLLLQKYCTITDPLPIALDKLESVQVPIHIAPSFPIADKILH